jgi:hypothetical protein
MKRITMFLAAAGLVLAVSVPTVLASGGGGTRIALRSAKAFPAAKGSAKFKAKPGERELEAEVEHVRRLVGSTVTFYVAGKKLGSAKVGALGAAHSERRNGAVPAVRAGTVVSVKTAGGVLIVKGSF